MNRIWNKVYVLFFTGILILTAVFASTKEANLSPYFQVQNKSGSQDISIFDAQNGNYYVFLPSYSNLEQVQIMIPPGRKIFLDDVFLSHKMTCESFELEKPYALSIDGENIATLWFYQSQNVATMFVNTASGEMTDIHADKNHEEYASLTLYSPDGKISYYDAGSKLKGRGNATWERDKRPYLLTLSSDGELLGMDRAKKWVLLANAYDETNLNNKLVYGLASRVGFTWSPDSRFVDLYLNGEYSGLYLLTEKIEVHTNRLDLQEDSGDFLCKADLSYRIDELQNPFESFLGRTIEVSFPNVLSSSDMEQIAYLVYQMELEISSGTDLQSSTILDLDSWVRRYLIDEISGNIDSDLASSYFYFSDGKFFGGPIWDYDMAFGNNFRNQEPCAFIAKNEKKATDRVSLYYGALFNNESFYQRAVEIYRTEFVPVLQEMLHHGIDDYLDYIQAASHMNSIRWRSMYDTWINETAGTGIVRNPEKLKTYFSRRLQFLNDTWLNGKDYCTVQFLAGTDGPYWNISVEKGTCLETTYMDLVDTVWIDTQTKKPVDFQSPITKDLIVSLQIPE